MVIDESTLLRLMKKAYKGGGYHVAAGESCYIIANYGYAWGVVIDEMHMPWSVLGLIVKHTGNIPAPEEDYLVHKDNVQEEVFEVAAKPILGSLERYAAQVHPALKRTVLIFDGRNVWQRSDNQEVVLFNPDYEELAVLTNAQPFLVDKCLCARGRSSRVIIGSVAPGDHEKEQIKHLSKVQWT